METTKQPLITVVMPNYNGRRFVEQAIDSVLNQTYSNFELLVVDDCSKDDSLQLIQQKAQSDDRIRIIALEHNAGVANARNVGIKEPRGSSLPFWIMTTCGLRISWNDNLLLLKKAQTSFIAPTTLLMSKTTQLKSPLLCRSRQTSIKCWLRAS